MQYPVLSHTTQQDTHTVQLVMSTSVAGQTNKIYIVPVNNMGLSIRGYPTNNNLLRVKYKMQ